MGKVEGHWRNGWVGTYLRHPFGSDEHQTQLSLPVPRIALIDLSAHGGPFPAESTDRAPGPALPSPRPPGDGDR